MSFFSRKGELFIGVVFLCIVLLTLVMLASVIYSFVYISMSGHETIIVQEKWVKYHGGDAKYLVSSIDGQVFEISDSLWYWRFDSSNVYAKVKPNVVYDIKTEGFRFPFFSDYKNIIELSEQIEKGE